MAAAWRAALASLVLAAAMPAAVAQTAVSGPVEAHTRWTLSGSPYVLTGEVSVRGGAVLSIDPGVTVSMTPGAGLTVSAGGIQALGTAAAPIRVISDKSRLGQTAAPGDWGQWTFSAGTVGTRLDHVHFEHGKGLRVLGSAPVFNYLDIRHQLGSAITIDLAASPTGVGNRAGSNTLNGIAVPAGDVMGQVRWGLRGLPYVVTGGVVSVGESPSVNSVSPTRVEQGQTVTLSFNGARLNNLTQVSADKSGLTFTPFSSGSSSQASAQLAVAPTAQVGVANLRVLVEAGELLLPNALTVTPPLPAISSLDPDTVLAGAGATAITLQGRNFAANSQVLFNGASAPTDYVSATTLRATLPNQTAAGALEVQVRTPDAANAGQYITSNTARLTVETPVPPTVAIEPTPIALPPDSRARDIIVRLSKADYRDHTVTASVSDTSKASVSPATLTIPAGQTTGTLSIVPRVAGTVTLTLNSSTLGSISVPLFITADFRGANTAYAPLVGVVLQRGTPLDTAPVTVTNATVGVAVGGVLTQALPRGWAVGETPVLRLRGVGLPSGAQVSVVPNTGLTLGTVTLNADATELSVPITTAADAPLGLRKLIVRDAAGKDVVFADPAQSMVQLLTGRPSMVSVEPIVGARGTTVKMVIRGQHLQQGQVRMQPAAGVSVDSQPTVSDDGRTLTAYVEVAPDAPLGERVVEVVTPSGATGTVGSVANRFTVVTSISGYLTPVASRLVGVVVGSANPGSVEQRQPASSVVGVLRGAGIREVTPKTGVVGGTTEVVVSGHGLKDVTAASVSPSTGLTVGALTANADGTELRFPVAVAADAALGLRRLTLTGANGLPLVFVRATDASFLIAAPVPELQLVSPRVLRAGEPAAVRLSLEGRNLLNVTGARFEPAAGVTVTGPFESDAAGKTLSFNVTVDASATPGTRAVVVQTAAGESSGTVHPGNLVRIAREIGPTYAGILSPPVGVMVGTPTLPSDAFDHVVAAPLVGVRVGNVVLPRDDSNAVSARVGVVVGASVTGISPNGWLQGGSGNLVLEGHGLASVTTVAAVPSTGVLLGSPVASEDGRRLTVPVSVAPDAPLGHRPLLLATATGSPVRFADPRVAGFGVGVMATMTSISPIVVEQGRSAEVVVRGTNLQGVTRVLVEGGAGVRASGEFVWSRDELGERLTVIVSADVGAALGRRVLRLEVPGGITTAVQSAANTITVVTPQ